MWRMPAMPRRSTLGPRSRNRSGSHVSHTWGGSTTWSSTLMILGITGTLTVVLTRRQNMSERWFRRNELVTPGG